MDNGALGHSDPNMLGGFLSQTVEVQCRKQAENRLRGPRGNDR